MGESLSATNCSSKETIFQKSLNALLSQTSDVQFIFDDGNDVVKIPANKCVLAAVSPVFDAMFNGDLKEGAEVKIIDAPASAFQEFLHFFYSNQVKLTMKNIDEVLKLVYKYDVADCLPVCADFLKANLTIDNVLWILHLAAKYQLNELIVLCKSKIQINYQEVMAALSFKDSGKLEMVTNSNDSLLTDEELDRISSYVLAVMKDVVISLSNTIDGNLFSITLASEGRSSTSFSNNGIIIFSLNKPMLLTDVFCSKVYNAQSDVVECSCEMLIEEKPNTSDWECKNLFTTQIELTDGKNHVKLPNPIWIKLNYSYAIIMKLDIEPQSHFTFRDIISQSSVALTPSVNISLPPRNGRFKYSLISHLYFQQIDTKNLLEIKEQL